MCIEGMCGFGLVINPARWNKALADATRQAREFEDRIEAERRKRLKQGPMPQRWRRKYFGVSR